MSVSRFAPSATGPAHPGTLLAGLLAWLDARSRGGRVVLRIEDLDPERSTPDFTRGLVTDLAWLGLDWDAVETQSEHRARHLAAVAALRAAGRLYACVCSRREIAATAPAAADGGHVYPGTCRRVPPREVVPGEHALRFDLDPAGAGAPIAVDDESGRRLVTVPGRDMGDPVVVRRDGAIAYHLASVVDDAAVGVDRVVRGRDLASSTGVQVALRDALGLPRPAYRHHLLLLEERGAKLAKLHGAVGAAELRARYDAAALRGLLAAIAGLQDAPRSVTPAELVAGFAWERVRDDDQIVRWTGERLEHLGAQPATGTAPTAGEVAGQRSGRVSTCRAR